MAKEGHHFVDSQRVAREKLKKEYVSKKWHGGKGSNQRPGDTQAYKDGWERIFGKDKNNTKYLSK